MSKVKILIVEDEAIIAENLAARLELMDYEITDIVHNGEDALKAFKNELPDLVLLDINLEGEMDGVDLAGQLAHIQPAPVIYLTAQADRLTVERPKRTHPATYMLKPINYRELPINIDLAISNFSQKQETVAGDSTASKKNGGLLVLNNCIFI